MKQMTLFHGVIKKALVLLLTISLVACSNSSKNFDPESPLNEIFGSEFVTFKRESAAFPLVNNGIAAPVVIDANDHSGLLRIVNYFKSDVKNVSGTEPRVLMGNIPSEEYIVLVGSLDKSPLIKSLVDSGKLNVDDVKGKWENSLIQVVDNPFDGVKQALVITGSDKRGTFFGVFDISRRMGVSPWYWWADVPVKQNENVFIKHGRYNLGEPKVQYRGIFLNDEEPALGRWAVENYGGFTHQFYENVFELLLRLKANYIWPAMWWAAFNTDDPKNAPLADEMGIVLGTSHHEPMDRAHAEWKALEMKGEWNYETNKEELQQFWCEGIERIGHRDVIVNMAMRGDGDEAMAEETNIELLEKIVADQRQIIEEVTGKPASETPQMWALYKEVQDYYEHGMRVPEDIALLLCDDNWGNVRMLPDPKEPMREGGYGMYYHFDFVGGPRSYKWLNVKPVQRVWEQMNLSYRHGVEYLWIVNVGDLKPMELPISFFLDFAWDPDRITLSEIDDYTLFWAREQFGESYADGAAEILDLYTKYNSRRTPEMLFSDTYSLINFREYEKVVADYSTLASKAEEIYNEMSSEMQPSFYQLAYQPTLAMATLYEMYYAHGLNQLYAAQARAATNNMADRVKHYFNKDAEITEYFHTELMDGKWNHMMAQPRIGYYSWQQPPRNIMPGVIELDLPRNASMGVAVEGRRDSWPGSGEKAVLPEFDSFNKQNFYIEVFNRGKGNFNVELKPSQSWVKLSAAKSRIKSQERIEVSVDWAKADLGENTAEIVIESNSGEKQSVWVKASKYDNSLKPLGHIERNGYVSIEATNYTNAIDGANIHWDIIPGLGRTGSSITTFPVTKSVDKPGMGTPALEYDFFILEKPEKGKVDVEVYVAPLLNFKGKEGFRYAVSLNDSEPQIINIHEGTEVPDYNYPHWFNQAVSEEIMKHSVQFELNEAGQHSLKIWMIDNAVLFQKIVVETKPVPFSYLGPPESKIFE